MSLVVLGGLLIFGMLIGTVAFQTQIARNQLALDKVEKEVVVARSRYDVLRRQRAELRSPNRSARYVGSGCQRLHDGHTRCRRSRQGRSERLAG